jgi:RHS repeat-associated protein
VTSIAGTVNGVVNPTYTYDADGNMLTGAGRAVAYTSFNSTLSIGQGTTNLALTYDPEHQRIVQNATVGGALTTTTYYNDPASGTMTEEIVQPGQWSWKTYLVVDGRIVAQRVAVDGSSSATMLYFVSDHLGSLAVITDSTGAVVGRQFYDAWGKERNADGSADTTCSLPAASPATRGYTSQEEMASVCLINYNARIYDPQIGRFMSADSLVSNPMNGQSYNRYSYTNNNPLNATDPSGHAGLQKPTQCVGADCGINGIPCWGCAGPGFDDGPNGMPYILGYGIYSVSAGGHTTYTNSSSELQNTIASIESANNAAGIGTILSQNYPGLSGVSIVNSGASAGDSGGAVGGLSDSNWNETVVDSGIVDGAEQITVTDTRDTNGGFNDAVYYPGLDAGEFSLIGGQRLTLHQMNDDLAIFRGRATSYYFPTEDDNKDLGVTEFTASPTYQWTQAQPNPDINNLGNQLITDIAYNPWPAFLTSLNPTNQDVARLAGYVQAQH